MPAQKYYVELSAEERVKVERITRSKSHSIRERTRARILLAADRMQSGGAKPDATICDQLRTSRPTVARVRQRFAEGGLEAALYHKQQAKRPPSLVDGQGEAHLIALVCGAPPDGAKRWTLRLLTDKYIEAGYVDEISSETIRKVLKKTNLSLG